MRPLLLFQRNFYLLVIFLFGSADAHLFKCAMRYFKVSLCDAGSRARASRTASSFLSGSESSERGEQSKAHCQRKKKKTLGDLGGRTQRSMESLPAKVIQALRP